MIRRLIPALDERTKTGKFNGELNFVRKDGIIFPGEISTTIFKDSEGKQKACMLIEDITERKRSEETLRQSEMTVRNKLKTIVEPEGDIGALALSDIIDIEVLRHMMEHFYKLTGMLGAVLDVSGKVLVAVGWQDICTKFHRCHPDSSQKLH